MDRRLITVILMAVVVALVITAIFYQITVGRRPTQTVVDSQVELEPLRQAIGELIAEQPD